MGLITEPAPPPVSAGRRLLRALCRLTAAGALVVVVARAVGGEQKTPLVELALLVPFSVVVCAVALVVAALVRARWTAVLLAALVAVQAVWVAPTLGIGVSAPAPGPPAAPVRVMTVNSLTGQADADRIVELVREQRIDLLATVEITPGQQDRLERDGLAELLPYRIGRTSRQNWEADGTVLWSRWPVEETAPLPATGYGQPRGVVRLPSGRALTVTAVHTLSPIPTRVQEWRADVRAITEGVAQVDGPQVVLGDFNAARDHAGFRRLLAAGDLVDAAEVRGLAGGAWPGFTWPANKRLLPPVFRLDHVLVTRGEVGVSDLQRVRVPGTDHLGLVAVLVA